MATEYRNYRKKWHPVRLRIGNLGIDRQKEKPAVEAEGDKVEAVLQKMKMACHNCHRK